MYNFSSDAKAIAIRISTTCVLITRDFVRSKFHFSVPFLSQRKYKAYI